MKLVRTILFCIAMLGLSGGYIASQIAALNGQAHDYSSAVDTPIIQVVSFVLLLVCFVMPFLRPKGGDQP